MRKRIGKIKNIPLWGKVLFVVIVAILLGSATVGIININISIPLEPKIDYVEDGEVEIKPEAKIINDEGKEEVVDVPTVESIESTQKINDQPDVGRGAYHDTSSYINYKNAVIGQCTDVDGKWGSQCFDLASDFWINYTGRWLSSCGTGAAKGTLDCWEYNAGNEFVVGWNARDIQPGDIVVFDNGLYGHIGMAMGYYNNGYVTLLGQNQGGEGCPGGGSKANIINISLAGFRGYFRPKTYIKKPEPKPEPKPAPVEDKMTGCPVGKEITLKYGDTLGQIMLDCTGEVKWGEEMNNYASIWVSTKVKPGQAVLTGWNTYPGVGLWSGDTIRRIK